MEAFETFEHAGFTVGLYVDEEPQTPADWDTLGTMHYFDRRDALQGWEYGGVGDEASTRFAEHERPGLIVRWLRANGELAVLFRFEDWGSSVMRVRVLGDDEDERATGYISCSFERAAAEFSEAPGGAINERARACLVSEVETWNAMLEGRVVGYVVTDAAGEHVDSCWGFYPDNDDDGDGYEWVRAEARGSAEAYRKIRAKRAAETVLGWGFAHGLQVAS